ncbi:MAG: hypothetical protein SOV85_05085 [Clostridium sp.]|uniref:hypothetical protein n=1 Tax=Clostridium sp. TaxID=1506 RepID=UPI002A75DD59|nr:hypothetical protein [Clostridium sp.]MDY2630713.1 hypothetical protein [Clostridium sp.]
MFKNFIDYNLYLFKIKRMEVIIVFIDLLLFITSTYTLISSWNELFIENNNGKAIIFVLLGTIIKFIYDLYNIISEIKDSMDLRYGYIKSDFQEKVYKEVKIENSVTSDYIIEDITLPSGKIERVVRSTSLDNYIREGNFELEESRNMERNIKRFIKENKDDLLPFLKFNYRLSNFYGKMFFNEKKLCISADIKINPNEKKVYCHKGSYYDTYLTNIISGKELRSNEDNKLIASAEDFMPVIKRKDGYYLKDITASIMNNEIGISTIAITSDNYLVIWTQNRVAQSSAGLLVPTGSGSCDWSDIRGKSFTDTIVYAMNRELWEENGGKLLCKSPEEIGITKILGTFRWINKGGKSEFVGLTKVNRDLISFDKDKKEVFDREEYLITSADDLIKNIDALLERKNISVPLYVNLKVIREYARDNKEEIEDFLSLK